MDVNISISDSALNWIAKIGFDSLFGARPIERALQRYLINDFLKYLLYDDV